MRAALYARYSTDQQREESIDDQFRETARVAAAAQLDVVCRFGDEGVSGGTAARPGYQNLLAAARRREFDIIVAEDVSRLWRNRAEFGPASAELEDLGVHLLTCVGDDTRRDGWGLVLGIKHAIAEHQRREISYRTRRGMEGLARAGRPTGPLPYGYASPEQAAVVQRIFAARSELGKGYGWISHELNRCGIPAPRGGRWSRSTVKGVLANPRYVGTVVWGKTERRGGARDSRLKRPVLRPEGPLVTYTVEPLVPAGTTPKKGLVS